MMTKAKELYQKLNEIESLLRCRENPDGSCTLDTDKVSIFLESAEGIILENQAFENN